MFKRPPYLIPIAIISILTALILMKCGERKASLSQSKTTNWNAAVGTISNLHISEITHTDENGNVIGKYALKPDGTMDHGVLYGQKPSSKNKSNWSIGSALHKTTELKEPVKVNKVEEAITNIIIGAGMEAPWFHTSSRELRPSTHLMEHDLITGKTRFVNINNNPEIKWLGQIFNGYECGLHPDGFMVWREAK